MGIKSNWLEEQQTHIHTAYILPYRMDNKKLVDFKLHLRLINSHVLNKQLIFLVYTSYPNLQWILNGWDTSARTDLQGVSEPERKYQCVCVILKVYLSEEILKFSMTIMTKVGGYIPCEHIHRCLTVTQPQISCKHFLEHRAVFKESFWLTCGISSLQ